MAGAGSKGGAEGPLVWITRAEPRASATARAVEAMGYTPLVSPLLRLEPTPSKIDLSGVAAIAFTSANGVRAFAATVPDRNRPVYAVGAATADAARAAGFAKVASADGDVSDLAALIGRGRPRGEVLHPGAEEPAGDLAGALAKADIVVRTLALYRSVGVDPTEALTVWERLTAVLLHSPKAAQALEKLMEARAAPGLHAFAISKAAAEPLKHLDLASVAVAPLPNEPALLNLLNETIRL